MSTFTPQVSIRPMGHGAVEVSGLATSCSMTTCGLWRRAADPIRFSSRL